MRRVASRQGGMVLVEALVAVLLFMVGMLGLAGAWSQSIGYEADTEYRGQATKLAAAMANTIWLNVDRSSPAAAAASLQSFAHLQTSNGNCNFSGTPSANALVTAWAGKITDGQEGDVTARLPGATAAMQQIVVNPANANQVTIALCWQSSTDAVPRQYVLRTYIN